MHEQTRVVPIVAQDPALKARRARGMASIATSLLTLEWEDLDEGPRSYRFAVIDYDATQNKMYAPWREVVGATRLTNRMILEDPRFHAQNVYAIAANTLARFERALGRRIPWGFSGQQLKIAPHAFQEANAYYSREHQALLFGYFPSRKRGWIYTCLAHDVIVHETTHAIIDGLRSRYLDPSHPDQAAFHEGFADVIALLSVFAMPDVTRALLNESKVVERDLIERRHLSPKALRRTQLLGLADELGQELSGVRGDVLRRSAELDPSTVDLASDEYQEPHRRGEVLVAALLDAFLEALASRLVRVGDGRHPISADQFIDEASTTASVLLTIAIRAIDYAPPVDVTLQDFLRAIVTSDAVLRPDDSRYAFRDRLVASFRRFGIAPTELAWRPEVAERYVYPGHAESLTRSAEEVHRFIWENRDALEIPWDAYTHVFSVQPCIITQSDGFVVRQTVCQYKQTVYLRGRELGRYGLTRPGHLGRNDWLKLSGGGVLVFDEFARLRYHVHQRVFGRTQNARIDAQFDDSGGVVFRPMTTTSAFAAIHGQRTCHSKRRRRKKPV